MSLNNLIAIITQTLISFYIAIPNYKIKILYLMKDSHHCPKCNNSDILRVPGPASVGYTQNKVPTGFMSSGNVDRYVCLQCGYSEEWIAKVSDLEKLRKKFGKKDDNRSPFV